MVASGTSSAQQTPHTNNHAVILSASRYWFNYRHASNAVQMSRLLQSLGFQNDHIVLMVADEYSVNPRNPIKNAVLNTAAAPTDLNSMNLNEQNGTAIHIDYRDAAVTVDQFVRVLTGRSNYDGLPTLHSNENSNVFLYLTGHGGDQFFKFRDHEEILADHLAETLYQMSLAQRYRNLLVVADTCQAYTMFDALQKRRHEIPNVYFLGSSLRDQSSYAHQAHHVLGLSVIEKYTHYLTQHLVQEQQKLPNLGKLSLYNALVSPFVRKLLGADLGFGGTDGTLNWTDVPVADFLVQKAPTNNENKNFVRLLPDHAYNNIAWNEYETSSQPIEQDLRRSLINLDEQHIEHTADVSNTFSLQQGDETVRTCAGVQTALPSSSVVIPELFHYFSYNYPQRNPNDACFVTMVVIVVVATWWGSRRW